jgi:peptidoglycan/LPS O-acetylase OafA/YrhL
LHLQVPPLALASELVNWFSLGALGLTAVNGYTDGPVLLAKVTWTLRFEWYFYFSLLLLAPIARKTKLHLLFAVGALMVAAAYVETYPNSAQTFRVLICVPFLIGMLCGSLAAEGFTAKLSDRVASGIVAILVCAAFVTFKDAYNIGAMVLFGGAFYLIVSGCTIFGLLTSRPARRLGDMSYGIYLLQGLAFALVFAIDPMRRFEMQSPLAHWSVVLLCAVLLVFGATATHAFIEWPGVELGKRLASAVRVPAKTVAAAPATTDLSPPLAFQPSNGEVLSPPGAKSTPE